MFKNFPRYFHLHAIKSSSSEFFSSYFFSVAKQCVFVWFMTKLRHPTMRLKTSLTKTDCKAITRKVLITLDKNYIFVLFKSTNWVFIIALQIAQFKNAIKVFICSLKLVASESRRKNYFHQKMTRFLRCNGTFLINLNFFLHWRTFLISLFWLWNTIKRSFSDDCT